MKLRTSGTEKKISLFIPLHIFAIIFISKVSDWNFSSVSVSLISFFYVSCFHRVLQNPASDTSRHTRGESNRHKLEWDFTLIFISSDCVCFELDWVAREIRLNVEIKFFFRVTHRRMSGINVMTSLGELDWNVVFENCLYCWNGSGKLKKLLNFYFRILKSRIYGRERRFCPMISVHDPISLNFTFWEKFICRCVQHGQKMTFGDKKLKLDHF